MRRKGWLKSLWKYVAAAVVLIIYLLPAYVLLMTSLKTKSDMTSRLLPPENIYLENYIKVFKQSGLPRAMLNSVVITAGNLAIVIGLGCLASYPMARCKGRLSGIVKIFILGIMMIPGMSMVVGVYSILVSLNAISTYWGLITVTAAFGLPFSVYMYSNFVAAIPQSLDDAAAIDGAGVLQTFVLIILPQLKPVTVSVILMQGISCWNEYGYALYILQKPEMYNVTLAVKQYFSMAERDLNGAAASAAVAIIPVIVLYLFLQKYFVQGVLDSAVKG